VLIYSKYTEKANFFSDGISHSRRRKARPGTPADRYFLPLLFRVQNCIRRGLRRKQKCADGTRPANKNNLKLPKRQ